jgi:DNA-binding response OmpR family regulator
MKTILAVTHQLELGGDLENAGYHVICTSDEGTARVFVRRERPDLVLLDLTTPGVDGPETCRRLRQVTDAPLLVATTNVDEAERAMELEGGADDFVLKPLVPQQLVNRIRVLDHWAEKRRLEDSTAIRIGDITLHPTHHQATVAGRTVDLTRTELGLLAALASKPGQPFSRSQLMRVLDRNRSISARTIDSHIKNLRAKIEPDPTHPSYILTVYGVGYRLAEDV